MMVSRSSEPDSSRSGILTRIRHGTSFEAELRLDLIHAARQVLARVLASRMALSVFKRADQPARPGACHEALRGQVGANVREKMGTQHTKTGSGDSVTRSSSIDNAPKVPSVRNGNSPFDYLPATGLTILWLKLQNRKS